MNKVMYWAEGRSASAALHVPNLLDTGTTSHALPAAPAPLSRQAGRLQFSR